MAKAFNLTAQLNIQGPGNIKPVVSAIKRELGAIKANVQVDIKGSAAKNIDAVTKKLQLMSAAATQATGNINTLSQALGNLSSNIGTISSASSSAGSSVGKVSSAVASAGKSISVATSQIEEFGKQSGLAIRRFAAFSTVTSVVYSLINSISSAYTEFVNFDKEIVRLSQVTGQSVGSLSGVTDEITRLSTSFGVASQDLLQVSVTLAQAGLSANDTKTALEALAKSALAPSFDNLSETVEGSIAAMRQFGIQAGDLEGALGSINAVAAAFAVESSDIITAIQRTGGVFAAASRGVTEGKDALNEFIAVFTSVRATTRESAETIATGLRTIFTRIQRGGTIESLKQIGVSLTDVEGKFVGPYEAVRRLSEALSTLDPRDLRFSQIVEELGGFRQIGKVIPLIQQFATAQDALKVAQQGQGSLAKDAITAQQSLAVQFTKTREAFVALVRDLGNSTTFKSIATISLTAANAFITLAGALKPLLPLLTALTAIKGASILTEFGSGFLGGLGKGGGGAASLGNMLGGGGGGGPTTPGGKSGGSTGGGGGGGSRSNNTAAITSNTTALSSNTSSIANLTTSVNNLISAINTSGGSGSAPLNSGGIVKAFARGGYVPGTGNRDTVPAMLQPGEFVIRKKAVQTIGANNLQQMNRYASGGIVLEKLKGTGKRGFGKKTIQSYQSMNPNIEDSDVIHAVVNRLKMSDILSSQDFANNLPDNNKSNLGSQQKSFDARIGVVAENLLMRKLNLKKYTGAGTRSSNASNAPIDLVDSNDNIYEVKFKNEETPDEEIYSKLLRYKLEQQQDAIIQQFKNRSPQPADNVTAGSINLIEAGSLRSEVDNLYRPKSLGGFIQKFGNGGEAERIKGLGRSKIMTLADKYGISYDKRTMYDVLGKRSPSIQESILIDGLIQQIVSRQSGQQQAELRASDIAQRRKVAVVGITGDPGEEETRTVGASMEGVGSVRGVPVTLQRGALPKDLADRVQAMIRAKIEEVVAEVGSVIAERAGTTPDLKSIASITSKDIEDMTGPIFEKALGVASGNYDPMAKSVDFPSGLDPKVAALVGVEPGVMTDIANVASKEIAKSKILSGQIDRGRLEARARFGASQFAQGGKVTRNLGYIDYDVIANEANKSIVEDGMKKAGVTGPRLYTEYLTDLAVQSRKENNLDKLKAIYGVAGSGKTTLARGQGTDSGTLRETNRFPILSPDDIKKANEIIVLSSTVSRDKLDSFLGEVDRAYTLSSTTPAEQDRITSQRLTRDTTGVGLEGRQPGTTTSIGKSSAIGEALLGDRLGSKSVVLGRTDSGRLRRKSGNELVDVIKKKIGFVWGGFAPTTAGHESIIDAAAAMGIPAEDFIALVGANEGIKSGDPSSYRTAVFDQDFRMVLAKAGFGSRGATVLPKSRDFEVPSAFDVTQRGDSRSRVVIPSRGSRAFVGDKTEEQTQKYKDAGYAVSNIGRNQGISGTMVRDLIMAGDMAKLQGVLSPEVYDIISNNIGKLQNRASVLPSIIQQVQASQDTSLQQIDEQINALGIKRVDTKKAQGDPEYAAQVEVLQELRKKKEKIKSAGSFEPYRLLAKLAQDQPDKYALDFSTSTSSIKPIRTVTGKSRAMQRFALGGQVYDLQKGTGLSDGEFNELVRYGKTNDFSEQEFKNYLAKYLSSKAAKKDLVMDPMQLREVLLSGTRTSPSTPQQMDLARQLMGPPDAKYNPKYDRARRFASGGSAQDTVPALLTPGEFVINRNAAKKIGYQKLNKLNKADKLQGFNKGGSVGNVLRMASGGSVSDDQMDYLRRKAQSLGITLEAYQKSIRDQIISTARANVQSRESNKTSIQDTIIENIGKIDTAEVETSVREKLDKLISGLDPGLKESEVKDRIDEIIQGMKNGLSVTDLKNTSASFKSVLDTEVKLETELARVKKEFIDKLGFLTGGMKPRNIDIRASDPKADMGLLGKADPRRTQRFRESSLGEGLSRYGDALSGKNLPGLGVLGSKFPELAKKIETVTDKFGGLTGVFSAGSAILGSKLPDFYKSIDAFTQGNLQVSESAAGLVGALREGGSLGLSGTLIGKQLYGKSGAAIGGTIGLAAGGISGYLQDSTAKAVENALKQVNASINTLNKDISDLSQARTVQEREDLTAKAEASYQAVLTSLDKSAKQIESNKGWGALQGAISGFVNALIQATSLITAIKVSQLSASTVLSGGGGGRRPRGSKSLGGRIRFFSRGGQATDGINWQPRGTDNIPAMLTDGEFVVNRESTSKNLGLLEAINKSRGGVVQGFSGGGRVRYFRAGGGASGVGGPAGIALAIFAIGQSIVGAISGAFDVDTQRQQLQAEVASLEALRSLVENSNSFSAINNQQYSDRVIAQSDIIEGAGLTPEQRIREYGQFSDSAGNFNEMNLLAEQQRRAALANKGFIVAQNQSVESYLDNLDSAGDARADEARATAKAADETLRRRAYIRARVKQGADSDVAAREYKNKAPEAQANIDKLVQDEIGRENRAKILADRLKIINSGIKDTTLNLIDIMNRFSAAITRVGADIEGTTQRTANAAQGLSGRATALSGTNDNVKIVSNILGASRAELSKTVDTLVSSMGNSKEAQQMGGFVKALQVVQQELPLILRETKGGGLEEGSQLAIGARLNDMFKGTGIDQNIVNKMVNDTVKYLNSKSAGRENFDMGELANDIPFISEFVKTAELAQKSLQEYAEAQKNAIGVLATVSDDVSESFMRLTDNTIKMRDINLRSAIDLKEQLGKNVSFGERAQPIRSAVSGLTGGLLDPNAISNQISDLIARKSQLEATPESQLGALGKGEIAKLTSQINRSQRALDTLANTSELASAALKKIDQQQQISSGQRRGVMDFFSKLNNPEAMIEMVSQKAAFDRVMGGGANRQDIALATQVLPLLEQTRSAEDFANIQKQFFNNVVNSLQNQAGGANTPMGQGWEEFRKTFEGAFDQNKNKPLQDSIDTYNQVTQEQIKAIQAQSSLLLQATATRTSDLDNVSKQFTESLRSQFDKIIKELSDAAARIAAVGMASGGVVKYFSMGGVDFTPKGTDTVPAMLTPGEFVVNRAATSRNLPLLQSINSGKYSSGGKVRYLQKGGLLDRSVASRFPMLQENVWSDISEGSSEIPASGLTKNDLFRYMDYRKDSDDIVKKYEFDDYNSAVKHHYEQYLSQSADQRYKALVDKGDLIEKLEKEKATASGLFGTTPGFLTGGQPQKYKELNKEINDARKWREKELKSNINWYKTYEAANAIKYSDRQVGDRNELEENYFGGDRNFPFTSNFQKIDNTYRRSQMGIEPADFETMMYGLASKAIPGLLGTIGGGLGVMAGSSLGLLTGPGAPAAVPAGAIGGGFLGGYIGDSIGQNINKYIWDNWTPQSVKDRIAKKMEEYPDSYAAGQWVGFGAEIAGGSVADDIIRKGVGSAGKIVSKQAQNLVSRNALKKLIKTIPSPIRAKDIPSKSTGLFDDISGKIVRQSKRKSSGVIALDSDYFDSLDNLDEDASNVVIGDMPPWPSKPRRETIVGDKDVVKDIKRSKYDDDYTLGAIDLEDIKATAMMRGQKLAQQFNTKAIKDIPQSIRNTLELLGIPVDDWIKVLPKQIRFGSEAEILRRAKGYFVRDASKYDSALPEGSMIALSKKATQKTLYHEMTHSLFDYVRTNAPDSWKRYQDQIGQIFRTGDRRGLAKVYESIKPGRSADALYGRQYKLGELESVLDDPYTLDILRDQIATKQGPVKKFLETFLTTRNRTLSPYDENINDAVNEVLELIGKGNKIPDLENTGAEEFLANLVGSAEKLTNKQRGYLSAMLDDLLAGPPTITRDNSALESLNQPTVFEKISQSFQRARESIKLPTLPRRPQSVKPPVKPDDIVPNPAAAAPGDLPGAPSTPGARARQRAQAAAQRASGGGKPKPRRTKGAGGAGAKGPTLSQRAGRILRNPFVSSAAGTAAIVYGPDAISWLYDWFRGNGTPPTAPAGASTPPDVTIPPPAAEEAKAKEAEQMIEGIRRKFEQTSQDSSRAFGFDKYKFGESMFFKPDDPLNKVGFYARSVSLPKYELGAIATGANEFTIGQGELLDPKNRQALERRLQELERDNVRSPEYFALRKKIEEDYRAQLRARSGEIKELSVSEPKLPTIDSPVFGPNGPVSEEDMKKIESANSNEFVKDGQKLLKFKKDREVEADPAKRKIIEDNIQNMMNDTKYSSLRLSASSDGDIDKLVDHIDKKATSSREVIRQSKIWDDYKKQQQEYTTKVQEYSQNYLLSQFKGSNDRVTTVPLDRADKDRLEGDQNRLKELAKTRELSNAEKAELARINDQLNRDYKLDRDSGSSEMMDYVFFNHPHDKSFQGSLLNPFKDIGSSKVFGQLGNDAKTAGNIKKNQLSKVIKDINLKYASIYGVNPANYMDIDSWISKIEPDKLSRISEDSLPLMDGLPWTMDIFENAMTIPPELANSANNSALKYGLWSLSDSGDAYDSKFGSNYTKQFLEKIKSAKTKTAKQTVETGNRLDKSKLETFIEMSKALNTYTSSMDRKLYDLPGVGPLTPTNVLNNQFDPNAVRRTLRGRTEKEKVAELQNIFGQAYKTFRKASIDKPFGYLNKDRLSDWETKDSVIKYPGTPEELRATVLADSSALAKIDRGDPSFIRGNFRASDALRVGAYTNLFSQGAGAPVADVRGMDVADPTNYSYAKMLIDAMNFDKDRGVSEREMMFDNFLGLDFNNNDKVTDVYKASAGQLKADIERLKSTYALWDSLIYYDNIKQPDNSSIIKARYIDSSGSLIDGTAPDDIFEFANGWRYSNPNKIGDFVTQYGQKINQSQTEYARIIDALTYASEKIKIGDIAPENILNPYNNTDYIQIKKFKQLQDTSDTGAATTGGTSAKPAGGTAPGGTSGKSASLTQDVKDQIKAAHIAVQLAATRIFGDDALLAREADEYTPLLNKLGAVLSTKVPNFNDPSDSKNLVYRAYRDHYTNPSSMKRLGDASGLVLLSDIESPDNKASMEKERQLRKALNSMVEPLYLSTGGRAVNFRPRGTDTVPAMLTPGEFVVNKEATRQHLPLLKSINQGANPTIARQQSPSLQPISQTTVPTVFGNAMYAASGGMVPKYLSGGGIGSMVSSAASAMTGFNVSALANIFTGFVDGFSKETKVFSTLIQDLARVFPALTGPVNLFGSHVDRFVKKVDELKGIEIKGPSIAEKVSVTGDVSVTLTGNTGNNTTNNSVKLDDASIKQIVNQVKDRIDTLIALGR